MSGISFMGVGSGLPVKEIIEATLAAESAPLKRLENDKKYYQSQISAMGQLKSRLSDMSTAMDKLKGLDKFQQLAAKSGNDKLFTAKADHTLGATAGNYNVEVLAEARNYRHVSGQLSTVDKFTDPGQLTFKDAEGADLKDKDDNVISINTENKTLDEIRAEINSHEGLKGRVSANIVNEGNDKGRLILKAGDSGEEGRFEANFSNTTLNAKDEALSSYSVEYRDSLADQPAKDAYDLLHIEASRNLDARIKIDGIEASSSTNKFENVVSGVTINVTAGAMNEDIKAANLGVKRDDGAIKDNIDAFAKAYNDVIIHLNEAKKGSLYGDNTIRSIEAEMRNILYAPTEGEDAEATQKNFLALIGIEVYADKNYDPENPNSRNGTLEINSAALTKALDENFDKVAHILGSSSKVDGQPSGYAERLSDLASRLVKGESGTLNKGLIEIREDGLKSQVKRIDDKVASTNQRLELFEARLVKQFSAIEGIVANLNSTGSFLSQQLSSLPGYSKQ